MNDTPNNDAPIVVERSYKAPIEKVWQALTDKDQMKEWYFDLSAFRPEVGFEFSFIGGKPDGIQYTHLCRILEVVPQRKLAYSWVYEGYEGYSTVSFELFPEGEGTRLVLTHEGIGSFPADNSDLVRGNFVAGWNSIIGELLPGFLEGADPSNPAFQVNANPMKKEELSGEMPDLPLPEVVVDTNCYFERPDQPMLPFALVQKLGLKPGQWILAFMPPDPEDEWPAVVRYDEERPKKWRWWAELR